MDNAPIHQSYRIKELVENTGNHMLFIPPYSPDCNPIEEVFSKLKSILKKYMNPLNLKNNIELLIADFCFESIDFYNYYEHACV